ncbi:peptidase M23-like protein [Kribbella pratensis]|uniref:Peptidase M23-like protein n=1 Tax=Kribbella pratensis TaxID=2512112 RepID=A0ABY2F508_9ACTN|nr:M23 family metallopeptidase [Kribbella pratensis]TDW81480.1 peptidase M23-like protein [Kribbella pratensis]
MNLALLPLAAPPPPPTPSPPPHAVAAWPLQPRPEIVRGFELPAKPWLPGHRGVDLAGRPGQPVLAATAGTITYAGALAGRGVVTIAIGPRRTTYEPVVPAVSVGVTVKTGTVIGRLSAAGSHCVPRSCLHWGLLQGKQYVNPLTLLPNRPVRLLPLAERPAQPAAAAPRAVSPAPESPPNHNQRAAKLVIAAAAALALTAGVLIRRG